MDQGFVESAAADEQVVDADRVERIRMAGIRAAGNQRLAVEGILVAQPLDGRAGQRQQTRAGTHGVPDRLDRVAAGHKQRVDRAGLHPPGGLVVAERLDPHVLQVDAERREDDSRGDSRPAAVGSDRDPAPPQVGHARDGGVAPDDHVHGRKLQHRNAAQAVRLGRALRQPRHVGRVRHVGEGQADVRVAGLDRLDVGH